ncbi:hypothetical protein ANCDUO_09070 [Ancylostoma duodenale]|uniref:Uncharacterized protein n=1 Tax=Ancylostoma duodenale TaxID=51022 RepID=A0A0C2CUT5_9BILA|nr:hypothetical protein ANCDUO_09070 [Ancylostoma duodenale]
MEMKMLRWMAGITRVDRIRNEKIRERFGIATIADKLRETRLRWKVSEEAPPTALPESGERTERQYREFEEQLLRRGGKSLDKSTYVQDVRRPESTEIEDLRKQVAELEMYRIRARLHIQRLREKIHSYKSSFAII